jgi:hypothetical protein
VEEGLRIRPGAFFVLGALARARADLGMKCDSSAKENTDEEAPALSGGGPIWRPMTGIDRGL